ncbi:myb DNA-binding domain superfamily protein-related [Anaeramoeba flamelloides]|uniref:Myb DNA-binding domain superfamily protein-related n=1 Tax=Anaeramoeba flamelloides TaxID=1746091 RepID=A0ABQ8Y7F2_9EUKA|nr:myb DNA-binding domain superfamily protein-related [Anaeramoeba flamelloides]
MKNKQLKRVGLWNSSLDNKLIQVAEVSEEKDWEQIARKFPEFDKVDCFLRYRIMFQIKSKKGPWNGIEDQLLTNAVNKLGVSKSNWFNIATLVPGRNPKQCRERWRNQLNPLIDHSPLTEEEEVLLIEKVSKIGNKWCKLSTYFTGRPDNMLKNHWYSVLYPKLLKNDFKGKNNLKNEKSEIRKLQRNIKKRNHKKKRNTQYYPPFSTRKRTQNLKNTENKLKSSRVTTRSQLLKKRKIIKRKTKRKRKIKKKGKRKRKPETVEVEEKRSESGSGSVLKESKAKKNGKGKKKEKEKEKRERERKKKKKTKKNKKYKIIIKKKNNRKKKITVKKIKINKKKHSNLFQLPQNNLLQNSKNLENIIQMVNQEEHATHNDTGGFGVSDEHVETKKQKKQVDLENCSSKGIINSLDNKPKKGNLNKNENNNNLKTNFLNTPPNNNYLENELNDIESSSLNNFPMEGNFWENDFNSNPIITDLNTWDILPDSNFFYN